MMNPHCFLLVFGIFLLVTPAITDASTETPHPCQRDCDVGPSKTCFYDFHVEYYFTMSKACYDCPHNLTDCNRHHCITADGVERGIVVINRMLPGPSVQVCQGDRIVVDVKNHLPGDTTSIHWHGLHMVGTPYMDGVPLVTQCPISPASAFRYNFIADNPGTHFYHSHSEFQRADGVFGPLIVRQNRRSDPHAAWYDYDLPEHVMMVSDWIGELGASKFVAHHHDDGDNKASSMIINGKGRIPKPRNLLTAEEMMPLAVFNVTQGSRYRFRMISNGFLNCPIQLSVDNHTLLVLSSDGGDIQPIMVDSIVIDAGERYDFVLNADQDVDSYWIRMHGLMDCGPKQVFQSAILRYQGAPETEPEEILTFENTARPGKVLNPVNSAPGDDEHVSVAELRALHAHDMDWTREPDRKFYLGYDFYPVNNLHFHDPEHYPLFGVEKNHRLYTPQINHISLRMPPSPPLSQYDVITPNMLCNDSTILANCTEEFCDCTYTLQIPLGSLVELVLIDEGVTFDATHPFHLHGSDFRVVAMERVASIVTVDQIKTMDLDGLITRNLIDAPIKDTVAVPDGGYTIIRFVAKNPGYWLFHCHLSFHIEVGMGLIFKVGEHQDFPPIPKNFPTCGSWLGPIEDESSNDLVAPDVTDSESDTLKGDVLDNDLLPGGTPSVAQQPPLPTISIFLDNFILPHRLVNGSLSHLEPPSVFSSGSSNNLFNSFICWVICIFVLQYFR